MDETELSRQVGILLEYKKQCEENFKTVFSELKNFNNIDIKLTTITKDIQFMKESQDRCLDDMGKKLDATIKLVEDLSNKFDELKDKPKNSLWNTIVEGKKTIITLGIGIGAAYFWEHIIAFLQKLFK